MPENNLVKIELGCGKTKADGFIGVDRFPLPGVDVIADMEKSLPFPDDYADVIYACHSLEHVENFEHLAQEIYRIARHGALVFILAPYCQTSLNEANFYHKTRFDENTFRFFTAEQEGPFALREYRCGHIVEWGLKGSDNSDCKIELTTLEMEFFYFQEYKDFSPEEQTNARRALNNVCDQIYYLLAVNKGKTFFSPEEKRALLQKGEQLAPRTIKEKRDALRQKDAPAGSILADIQNWIGRSVASSEKKLSQQQTAESQALRAWMEQGFQSKEGKIQSLKAQMEQGFQLQKEEIQAFKAQMEQGFQAQEGEIQTLRAQMERGFQSQEEESQALKAQMEQGFQAQEGEIQGLKAQMEQELSKLREGLMEERQRQEMVTRSLAAHVLEQVAPHFHKPPRRFHLGLPAGRGLFDTLCLTNPTFADGLILHDLGRKGYVPLAISGFLPNQTYVEYPIRGWGQTLNFFLLGLPGSRLFVEVVAGGAIICQADLAIHGDGMYCLDVPPVAGRAAIRFRLQDNCSLIRTVEIRKNFLFFSRRELACFISP